MKINGQEISERFLNEIFNKESEKVRIALNYNYFKLLDAVIKCRKDFNIGEVLKKSDDELRTEQAKIELPSLDRLNKNNLKFIERKREIPKDFKNKIKIA